MSISVALATFNEADNLDRCLSSISGWVGEIIVVDGGSTDNTLDIARNHHARIINSNNPAIFHINKQKALDYCKGSWILQLDADEEVTGQLKAEIIRITNHHKQHEMYDGYFVPRRNYFLGSWMRKGGMYPDYVIRLFKRNKGAFPCKSVHEQIQIDGSVGYVKNPLNHYTAPNMHSYWMKAQRYITLRANEFNRDNTSKSLITFFYYLVWAPVSTFFSIFIRHKGIFDGWRGFLFAFFSAIQIPLAYSEFIFKNKQ